MKSYIFIHPFGGDQLKLEKGRSIVHELRKAHPEVAIAYPLDMIHYEDKAFNHDDINKWCAEWVRRSDGIIFPPNAMESDGCRQEIETAENTGKEVYPVAQFLSMPPFAL